MSVFGALLLFEPHEKEGVASRVACRTALVRRSDFSALIGLAVLRIYQLRTSLIELVVRSQVWSYTTVMIPYM